MKMFLSCSSGATGLSAWVHVSFCDNQKYQHNRASDVGESASFFLDANDLNLFFTRFWPHVDR